MGRLETRVEHLKTDVAVIRGDVVEIKMRFVSVEQRSK